MATIKNAIVGNRMQGLAGVDSWTSSGIAKLTKEPPKSLTVRRIVKVGQNNDLLDELANSYDRLRGSLRTYPLGVNPMVAVQFHAPSSTQTSLPYKLSSAFRPPLMPLEQTLPLSRQHRKTVEISINSVVPSTAEPFFFHKPLKEALVVDGGLIASAPRAQKEVLTQGYRIKAPDRVKPPERPRLESRRIMFENPRVICIEEAPLRIPQSTNKTEKRVAVPQENYSIVLEKQPLHSDTNTTKSSSAGVFRHQPKNIKLANPISITDYKSHSNMPSRDSSNRNTYPRTKGLLKTETRSDLNVVREDNPRPKQELQSKMIPIEVKTSKTGPSHPLPNDIPNAVIGTSERPLSSHSFLHNR